MDMIETKALEFAYPAEEGEKPVLALRGVDTAIEKGSFVVVLGHNGSGKSTFAKSLNAILLPCGGKVYVEGMDTQDEAFSITYENSDGVWIKFRCTTVAVAGDSERGTFSEITVQGKPAMLMLADAPGDWNAVTWADEEYGFLFDITSSYDYKELIRMAESVELVLEPE